MLSSPSKSNPHTSASSSAFVAAPPSRRGQRDEQVELPGRERHLARPAPAAPLLRVDAQVANGEHAVGSVRRAADQRPQASDEHDEAERLAQEVVGAELQALGLVVLALLGRQHQDRRAIALGAQLPADGVAVEAGQQDVEHDRRVDAFERPPQPVGTGVGDVDLEPLGAQAAGDRLGEAQLVLDDQHAHDRQSDRTEPRMERALSERSAALIGFSTARATVTP